MEQELALLISAKDQASRALKQVGTSAKGLDADVKTLGKGLDQLGLKAGPANSALGKLGSIVGGPLPLAAAAAGAALVALGGAIAGAVAAAAESERVMAQTEAVVRSTGGAAGLTATQVADLAESLSRVIPVDDELIQSTENVLLTFTKISGEIFPQVTEAALDMSTALGTDTKSAAIQLGKALQDPVAGLTALRRVGVAFTDAQKEQIKALQESGDLLGAQTIILRELQTEFGGSARAAGETFAGQLAILGTQLGNVAEDLGAALLPALKELVTAFIDVFNELRDAGAFDALAQVIRAVVVPAIRGFVDLLFASVATVRIWQQYILALSEAGQALAAVMAGDLASAQEHFNASLAHGAEAARIYNEALDAQVERELKRAGATLDGARRSGEAVGAHRALADALDEEGEAAEQAKAQLEIHAEALKVGREEALAALDAAQRYADTLNETAAASREADQGEAERHRQIARAAEQRAEAEHEAAKAAGQVAVTFGGTFGTILQGVKDITTQTANMAGSIEANSAAWKRYEQQVKETEDQIRAATESVRDAELRQVDEAIAAVERKRDAAVDAIEDQIDAESRRHDAALAHIDAERDAALGILQGELDAIDAAEQARERAKRDRELASRLAEAQARGDIEAIAAAREAIADEAHRREVEDARAAIRDQMEAVRAAAEEQKQLEQQNHKTTIDALTAEKDAIVATAQADLDTLKQRREATVAYFRARLEAGKAVFTAEQTQAVALGYANSEAGRAVAAAYDDAIRHLDEMAQAGVQAGAAVASGANVATAAVKQTTAAVNGLTGALAGAAKVPSPARTIAPLNPSLRPYATGGYMPPGSLGLVGERGPEVVLAGRNGATVIPNGGWGGTANINVTVNGAGDPKAVADLVIRRINDEWRQGGSMGGRGTSAVRGR